MNIISKRTRLFATCGLYCGSALAGLAVASAAAAQLSAATGSAASGLEEIVVTAQRRSERLEDVPMSIVAMSAAAIQNAGINDIHELGQIAPGVQVNFGGANTQTAIRGITTLTNGFGVENNVAVYVDGFYEPVSTALNGSFANIASVEVLKGPQGTLYGRNATGGAILINTLAPTRALGGKLDLSYGRFDDRTISGYLAGPIGERLRYSVAGSFRDSDGSIELIANPVTGAKAGDAAPLQQHSVRSKLEFDVADDLTATLGYNYSLLDDARGQLFTPFEHKPATYPAPSSGLIASRFGTASYNGPNRLENLTHQGTLKIAWNTAAATLASYTSYARDKTRQSYDFDGTFLNTTFGNVAFKQDTFQQAFDVTLKSIEHLDLIMGGLYYSDKVRANPDIAISNYFNGNLFNRTFPKLDTEAAAAYIDGTYHFTDDLSLNLGGRYSREEKEVFLSTVSGTGAVLLPPTNRRVTFSKFTPRASLRYEIAPRTNIYASYSKGFRSGTYNLAGAASPALVIPTNPENVDAYEIGFKTAQALVRLDVSAFYYDYTDMNASVIIPNPTCAGQPGCSIANVFSNAKAAEIYGVDGQITLTPIERLDIRVGGAWLHAPLYRLQERSGYRAQSSHEHQRAGAGAGLVGTGNGQVA